MPECETQALIEAERFVRKVVSRWAQDTSEADIKSAAKDIARWTQKVTKSALKENSPTESSLRAREAGE